MNVFYLSGEEENIEAAIESVGDNSLVIMGYGDVKKIDLVKELNGESNVLRAVAYLSRSKNSVFIVGVYAELYGKDYVSAAVLDRGRILGISDMTHLAQEDKDVSLGSSYRIYSTCLGKIGVVVGNDVFYPEVIRAVTLRGADFIVNVTPYNAVTGYELALRSNALFNGIMIFADSRERRYLISRDGAVTLRKDTPRVSGHYIVSRDRTLISGLRQEIYNDIYIEE